MAGGSKLKISGLPKQKSGHTVWTTPDEFNEIWIEEHARWVERTGTGMAAVSERTGLSRRSASARATKYRNRKDAPVQLPKFTGGQRGDRHDWSQIAATAKRKLKETHQ